MEPFEIVCCLSLKDVQVYNYLMPLVKHKAVSKVWVIRAGSYDYKPIPKTEFISIKSPLKTMRFMKMILACLKIGKRKSVKAFVSFNPFPYGLFSYLAAKWRRKQIHFGFIGSDWNIRIKKKKSRFLMSYVRNADLITLPGKTMFSEAIKIGLDEDQLAILPNTIDPSRFGLAEPEDVYYTGMYIGDLIPLKRVDTIIEAIAQVVRTHPGTRFCILGDGPLKDDLMDLAEDLGVDKNIEFTGFVDNVPAFVTRAKLIFIASENEGFPFALMEGMCSGLIPITTGVGNIPDHIIHGRTGMLFEVGDSKDMAKQINRVLDEPGLYHLLRQQVLEHRKCFSFEAATEVWDSWFKSFDE